MKLVDPSVAANLQKMKKVDISRKRNPFAPISEGAFFFVTDQGCYYTVAISESGNRFTDNQLLRNNKETCEISFSKKGEALFDEFISRTIRMEMVNYGQGFLISGFYF